MILIILSQENDDATRSINTFCELITDSIKSGMNNYSLNSGDPGNSESLI